MCSVGRVNVFSFGANVSSFRANVSSFWPNVFSFEGVCVHFGGRCVQFLAVRPGWGWGADGRRDSSFGKLRTGFDGLRAGSWGTSARDRRSRGALDKLRCGSPDAGTRGRWLVGGGEWLVTRVGVGLGGIGGRIEAGDGGCWRWRHCRQCNQCMRCWQCGQHWQGWRARDACVNGAAGRGWARGMGRFDLGAVACGPDRGGELHAQRR